MRSESEPKAKKQRMEESNQQTGTAAAVGTHFHGIKRMALTFAEFLSDPFTFSPRPEFIENFFIDVLTHDSYISFLISCGRMILR